VILDFCDEKKPHPPSPRLRRGLTASRPAVASAKVGVYPLRYIEDFFSSQKLAEHYKIRFHSREGVRRPSLSFRTKPQVKPAEDKR
jgi:hypothetical protein